MSLFYNFLPVNVSQTMTLVSAEEVATVAPSGEKEQDSTSL